MQTEIPALEDVEYENIPNLWPKSETTCPPEVEKMMVTFVGSREGELLEDEDEQDEQSISIVDLRVTDGAARWPNLIWIEVSDFQTDDCKADCDALMETVESNVV